MHPKRLSALCLLALLFSLSAVAQDHLVYADTLQNGWQNWSWAPVSFSSSEPVRSGTAAIRVTPVSGWQALSLHHDKFDSSHFQSLSFWIHGGVSGGQQLQVRAILDRKEQTAVKLPVLKAGTWQHITIPLTDLGAANKENFDGIWIQNATDASMPEFFVDDIALVPSPPPEIIKLDVDATRIIRTIDDRIYGINAPMWDKELGSSATREMLAAMNTRLVRIPGGSGSDDYDWTTNRSISNGGPFFWWSGSHTFAKVIEAHGTQAMVTVNYGSGTPEMAAAWVAWANADPSNTVSLGVDAKGRDWKTVGHWATMRASAPLATDDGYNFLRLSHPAPLGWRYWEVGNECYGSWEHDEHGVAGKNLTGVRHDAKTYAQWFKEFYDKMLAVDPTIKIGAVVVPGQDVSGTRKDSVPNPNENNALHNGWTPVVLATLKSLGVTPHFVVHHFYPQHTGKESDDLLLQSSTRLAADAADLRKQLTDYIGGAQAAGVELTVTELNSVSSDPGKQTTSLLNGLFMADAIGALARTEFNVCTWWDLRNGPVTKANNSAYLYGWRQFGDYGVVASENTTGNTPINQPFPTFYAAKLLTHWGRGGDQVVSASSNYFNLSVHAAKLASGNLALLVINKHATRDLTAEISLNGFVSGSRTAKAWQYGKPNDAENRNLTASTLDVAAAQFRHTFSSYSMTVIVLEK